MDPKLRNFVTLLHQRPPRSTTDWLSVPRRRSWPRLRAPKVSWPDLPLRLPRQLRFWVNVGSGLAVVAVISVTTLLALPQRQPERRVASLEPAAGAPVGLAPKPKPEFATRIILPPPTPPEPASPSEENAGTAATAAPIPPVPPPAPPPPAAARQVAALVPPPIRPQYQGEPPWRLNSVATPPSTGLPRIAIVLDDLGVDRKRTERAIALKGPLTLSFMAYATDLPRLTEEARRAGHELMVHVPMEPLRHSQDMGPNGLSVGLSRDEVLRRLRWDLGRFDGYVGINNHMGSRFTSDPASMTLVLEELKARGLLFLDSRTIGSSVGAELARKLGVPAVARDVFLDDEATSRGVSQQLAELEAIARRRGVAIAIGHPHEATLAELAEWLTSLPSRGIELVPVSAIVKERLAKSLAEG